jgi:hypothetical protein
MCRIDEGGNVCTTEVKIKFDDGVVIKRIKGPGINKYVMDDLEFENFGYSIPQQILEKLKIYPFVTNKAEFKIHIAMQDEKSFLIHESAPVRASILDTLTGVSLVQKAISEFNKENLTLSRRTTEIESRKNTCETELKVLPDVDMIQILLNEAVEIKLKFEDIEESICHLGDLKLKYEINKQKIKEIPDVNLDNISIRLVERNKCELEHEKLKHLRDRLVSVKRANVTVYDNTNLESLSKQHLVAERYLQQLVKLRQQRLDNLEMINDTGTDIDTLEKEMVDLKEKAKVCPTCGKPL